MGRAVPMINILYVACHIYDIDDAELKKKYNLKVLLKTEINLFHF